MTQKDDDIIRRNMQYRYGKNKYEAGQRKGEKRKRGEMKKRRRGKIKCKKAT